MNRFFSPFTLILLAVLCVSQIFTYSGGVGAWFYSKLLIIPAIMIGLSIHEFGHAIAADRLGDPTPRNQGRCTINPAAHIDPIGLICLFFAGFGWGVPVEINPYNFRNRRRDELLVSIAGVMMNLVTAIVFTGIVKVLSLAAPHFLMSSAIGSIVREVLLDVIWINIVLMVFNLIPCPPLDGFNFLTEVFDLRKYEWWYTIYNNGFMILMLLILFNITSMIISPAASAIYSMIIGIFF